MKNENVKRIQRSTRQEEEMKDRIETVSVYSFLHRTEGKVAELYAPDREFALIGVHNVEADDQRNKLCFRKLLSDLKKSPYRILKYQSGGGDEHPDAALLANHDVVLVADIPAKAALEIAQQFVAFQLAHKSGDRLRFFNNYGNVENEVDVYEGLAEAVHYLPERHAFYINCLRPHEESHHVRQYAAWNE